MNRFFALLCCLCLPVFGGDVQTLDTLVGQWVELRRAQSAEQEAWKDEKARLSTELDLLTQASDRLTAEKERLLAVTSEEDQARATSAAEILANREAFTSLEPALLAAEKDVKARLATLPEPLARRIADDLEPAASTDPLRRLRTVFALQEKILELEHGLHTGRERVSLPDGPREMDVLWIGTTQAFAVTADDNLAAEGRPGADGWTWRLLPGEAAQIRKALKLVLGEAPPALIELPLSGGVHP